MYGMYILWKYFYMNYICIYAHSNFQTYNNDDDDVDDGLFVMTYMFPGIMLAWYCWSSRGMAN